MPLKLGPGERVLFEGHPSWRSILDVYIKGVLAVGVIAALAGIGSRLFGDSTDYTLVTVIVLAGATVVFLWGLIKRIATQYTVTSRRLHIRRGIVSRTVQETRLERVQNVNFSQSILQRVLGIGDVDFDTAAFDDNDFMFTGIADPANICDVVDKALHESDGGLGEGRRAEREPA